MNLHAEMHIVYCFQWEGEDDVCKIGKSRIGSVSRTILTTSTRWNYRNLNILGCRVCEDSKSAFKYEKEMHKRFNRIRSDREWFYYDSEIEVWLKNECIQIPIETFRKLDVRRKKDRYEESKRYRSKPGYKERKNASERQRRQRPEVKAREKAYREQYYRDNPEKKAEQNAKSLEIYHRKAKDPAYKAMVAKRARENRKKRKSRLAKESGQLTLFGD